MTVAALMCAVSMTVGVSIMIFSFRSTVDNWIDRTMAADIFLGPAANEVIGIQAYVPESVVPWLKAQSSITTVDTYLEQQIELDGRAFTLAVVSGDPGDNLTFTDGDPH